MAKLKAKHGMRDYKRFARESDESSDEDKKVKKSLNFSSACSFIYRINLCTSSSSGVKSISLNENMRSGEGTEQYMNDGLVEKIQ